MQIECFLVRQVACEGELGGGRWEAGQVMAVDLVDGHRPSKGWRVDSRYSADKEEEPGKSKPVRKRVWRCADRTGCDWSGAQQSFMPLAGPTESSSGVSQVPTGRRLPLKPTAQAPPKGEPKPCCRLNSPRTYEPMNPHLFPLSRPLSPYRRSTAYRPSHSSTHPRT